MIFSKQFYLSAMPILDFFCTVPRLWFLLLSVFPAALLFGVITNWPALHSSPVQPCSFPQASWRWLNVWLLPCYVFSFPVLSSKFYQAKRGVMEEGRKCKGPLFWRACVTGIWGLIVAWSCWQWKGRNRGGVEDTGVSMCVQMMRVFRPKLELVQVPRKPFLKTGPVSTS